LTATKQGLTLGPDSLISPVLCRLDLGWHLAWSAFKGSHPELLHGASQLPPTYTDQGFFIPFLSNQGTFINFSPFFSNLERQART
jgi:hypothetical protein